MICAEKRQIIFSRVYYNFDENSGYNLSGNLVVVWLILLIGVFEGYEMVKELYENNL
jgi:hypothetical protein